MPMTPEERREYEITVRQTVVLSKQISQDNWPVIQNVSRGQATEEWETAHRDDSWQKIQNRINEAIR